MLDRMKRRYGVEVETQIPRISYRETVTKLLGRTSPSQEAVVVVAVSSASATCAIRPLPSVARASSFKDAVVGGVHSPQPHPCGGEGRSARSRGRGSSPNGEVVDIEIELYDGKFHAVDSDEASFKMAGSRAFRDGFEKAGHRCFSSP